MISLPKLLAVARAEARLTRRLVRYWVFVLLASGLTALQFTVFVVFHRLASHVSPLIAGFGPRYLIAIQGNQYIVIFIFGCVFLAFDVRARDVRDRVADVLDAKPISNLEVVFGRLAGLTVMTWIPMVVLAALFWLAALIFGTGIEMISILDLATTMAIPALVFALGLTMALAIVLRNRLVTAIVAIVVWLGWIVGRQQLPVWATTALNFTGAFSLGYPSDIARLDLSLWGALGRAGWLAAGLGLAAVGAALYPRRDGARRLTAGAAVALLAVGVGLIGAETRQAHSWVDRKAEWLAAHEAARDRPIADVVAIEGRAVIEAEAPLALAIDVTVRAPRGATLERALFTLNPGLSIAAVETGSGASREWSFENGLLDVGLPRPIAGVETAQIRLEARGALDPRFAFLRSAKSLFTLPGADDIAFTLGSHPGTVKRNYAALLADLAWLPRGGTEATRDDTARHPVDFVRYDLTVDVPGDWQVAGPGRGEPADGAGPGRKRLRFAPQVPLREFALIGAPLARLAAEVRGVELIYLADPDHVATVLQFAEARDKLIAWVEETLEEAEQFGLAYPLDAITVVEAPNSLRAWGGGWRLGSRLGPPGVAILREQGFPTADFRPFFDDRDDWEDPAQAEFDKLREYFTSDVSGANPLDAIANTFFAHLTAPRGRDAVSLGYVVEALAKRVLTGQEGYFSAHLMDRNFQQNYFGMFQGGGGGGWGAAYASRLARQAADRPEVWDALANVSLSELDPWDDPRRTLDVLSLKARGLARALYDGLGRDACGRLLGTLRERHLGETFTRDDVVAAARAAGIDLDVSALLSTWLDQTALPGFVLEKARVLRLADEEGQPRYQLLVTLSNREPVDGWVRVTASATTPEGTTESVSSDTVRIRGGRAVEIGLTSSFEPVQVTVDPYVSLNREPFSVSIPSDSDRKIADVEPFRGAREVDFTPEPYVVADDLDARFEAVGEAARSISRLGGPGADRPTDGGLPIFSGFRRRPPGEWVRAAAPGAYGLYRHTLAVTDPGRDERYARFRLDVETAGAYSLEIHVPDRADRGALPAAIRFWFDGKEAAGTWRLVVRHPGGETTASFDTAGAHGGWNEIERLDLAPGEVVVELHGEARRPLIADAVRLVPRAASGGTSR